MSRGRGGGRFRGGRSGANQNFAPPEIDDRNPRPLFPVSTIPAPSNLSDQEKYNVRKMREMYYRFQSSPYYLQNSNEESDIERYSDKYRKSAKSTMLLSECLNFTRESNSKEEISRHIPLELVEDRLV